MQRWLQGTNTATAIVLFGNGIIQGYQPSTTPFSLPPQEIPPRSFKRIKALHAKSTRCFFLATSFLSASAPRPRSLAPVRCSKYLPSARCGICKTRYPPSAMPYPRQTRYVVTPCHILNSSYHFDRKQNVTTWKPAVQVPKVRELDASAVSERRPGLDDR